MMKYFRIFSCSFRKMFLNFGHYPRLQFLSIEKTIVVCISPARIALQQRILISQYNHVYFKQQQQILTQVTMFNLH